MAPEERAGIVIPTLRTSPHEQDIGWTMLPDVRPRFA